ncbi:MAG: aminotransferase class I/II-fold pyridoxal phosphate-dependent enzyme [Hyphomicrobiaceae bacterium]|nr:aminotransferase class I/II-fold pyridoxal phosphate-dependent enzyme [Hyphomicrobiaceae bacterium]
MATTSWNKRLVETVGKWGGSRGESDNRTYKPASFAELPIYKSMRQWENVGSMLGVKSPFFKTIEAADGNFTTIDGTSHLNFAWCDYLGLNQEPAVAAAMKDAIDKFGPCTSASRMVAGETPLHQALEREVSDFLGVEDAVLFVSGHAANVSCIGTVMSEDDLIVHDEFVHNSAVIGMRLSRATTISFKHNDFGQLEQVLKRERHKHRNCLVIIEGLYSTEGDITDLPRAIELKERFGSWLMVDDAHGLGVLGKCGRGIAEHAGVDASKVDIWMGTLSKTLASCGGYIAGNKELIQVLKHQAPGFVYSVGLLPAMTAAALASLRIIKSDPERVQRLHAHGRLFLDYARERKLNTGISAGYGMLPVIAGDVLKAVKLWHAVFARGINPSLIVYPGVPIKAGRLRFFLTTAHSEAQIRQAIDVTAEELAKL